MQSVPRDIGDGNGTMELMLKQAMTWQIGVHTKMSDGIGDGVVHVAPRDT